MYKEQETDKVKLIIFDLYYNRGITKGIDLAKHLGINKDYACKYIREMKQTIRNYEKQNETRD
jgi:DNA-binding transcriptional regulator LsrR (DeoR family)